MVRPASKGFRIAGIPGAHPAYRVLRFKDWMATNGDFTQWGQTMAQAMRGEAPRISQADERRAQDVMTRYAKCMQRAMQ